MEMKRMLYVTGLLLCTSLGGQPYRCEGGERRSEETR